MKAKELREQDTEQLLQELSGLLDKRLKLSMEGSGQQNKQNHQFGEVRRDIARIKTVLREKLNESNG